jgi:hypothetical protein
VNDPPGSKPILVESGQQSVEVEVETVSFDLDLDMSPDEYDEAAIIAELAALYGINASLISLEATVVDADSATSPPSLPQSRRRLQYNGSSGTSGTGAGQRLRLKVTILVPDDYEEEAGDGELVDDTDSSLTVGGTGTGYSGAEGSTLSAAQRLANRLTQLNGEGGSGISLLGFSATMTEDVTVGTTTQEVEASCPPGYCADHCVWE